MVPFCRKEMELLRMDVLYLLSPLLFSLRKFVMKLKNALSLLALASCAALSASVMAQDTGTIQINGSISPVSCTPTLSGTGLSGSGGNYTLQLDSAVVDQYNFPGATGGDASFQFDWAGCSVSTGIDNVWVHFNANTVDGNGRIVPDSGSNKMRFELLDGTNPITAGGPTGTTGPGTGQGTGAAFGGTNPNKTASKTYSVRYYANSALAVADAGAVSATVTYNAYYY